MRRRMTKPMRSGVLSCWRTCTSGRARWLGPRSINVGVRLLGRDGDRPRNTQRKHVMRYQGPEQRSREVPVLEAESNTVRVRNPCRPPTYTARQAGGARSVTVAGRGVKLPTSVRSLWGEPKPRSCAALREGMIRAARDEHPDRADVARRRYVRGRRSGPWLRTEITRAY